MGSSIALLVCLVLAFWGLIFTRRGAVILVHCFPPAPPLGLVVRVVLSPGCLLSQRPSAGRPLVWRVSQDPVGSSSCQGFRATPGPPLVPGLSLSVPQTSLHLQQGSGGSIEDGLMDPGFISSLRLV